MRKRVYALVLCLCGAGLAGCAVTSHLRLPAHSRPHVHQAGPPPHAPAHGHRHHHHAGVELVFDAKVGVYVVVGHPGHYFHDGHYFRRAGGVWHMSVALDKGWATVETRKVPRGLLHQRAKERKHSVPAKHRP